MPELPEVETIRRGLSKFILKRKITKIEVRCEKSYRGALVTGEVTGLRRYGKAMIIDLDDGMSLLIHLRMTGQLIYRGTTGNDYAGGHPSENFLAELPNKQTRVIIYFDDGILFFNDQRKFGFIKAMPTMEVEDDDFVKKLAPEPWVMRDDEFYDKLQRHKMALIKAVLLDQTIICGLGNIYADEALYQAKIHPERRAGSVNREETKMLLEAARNVMDRSIDSGGSTMATYVKADGTRGDYLEKFAKVFRREGQPCERCGAEIVKMKVAGRGTHICPKCQRRVDD